MNTSRQIPSSSRRWLALASWLLLCFSVATFGGMFTPGEWYASLKKPSWNPPGWIFGPVWVALYTMMGISAWLVWQRGEFAGQRRPLTLFLVQLTLNAVWSPLFFGLHSPALAFVEIVLLWLAIVATFCTFHPVSQVAAWLLMPYVAWVGFAAVLNFTLWRLNVVPM